MKRRDFLQHTASSFLLPVLVEGRGIRALTSESPFMQALLRVADQTDRVLVIVQLQGGNDGLNTVIPLDQMGVYAAPNFRGNIAIPEAKALKLASRPETGLHPAMTGFQQLFSEGKLSIVQGVSYPSPSFSHFRASDIWMTAVDATKTAGSGWAGRYLDTQYPGFPIGYPSATFPDPPAIQIGYVASSSLLGPTDSMAILLQDPDTFARLVGDKPNDPPSNTLGSYAGGQVSFIRQQQASAVSYAAQIKVAAGKAQNLATYPAANNLAAQLKIIARLIAGGLKTKVYYLTIGGFDTHAGQVDGTDTTIGLHATLLKNVSDAITAFQSDLTRLKIEDRVVGMTFSEFGRRAISNGSRGTDHGTSAPMFIFGTAVKTQMVGKNPNLSDLENSNLKMQTDFRQVYSALLQDWFGASQAAESSALFRDFPATPVFQQLVTGVEPVSAANARLYPNPAVADVTLDSDWLTELTALRVADLAGRSIPVSFSRPDPRSIRLNVRGWPNGTYVLRAETSRGVLTQRLVVLH
ncbi:MAG: DUF1501 domain-containing protein [Bacteroidetes bacterium]|nr:DUF1501 domain-containing protein [Fibrella sp.]